MTKLLVALAALVAIVPMANAEGLLPVNPIVNGDFDNNVQPGGVGLLYPFLTTCVGVGHQVYDPLYSSWGDWVFAAVNDPTSVDPAGETFVDDATGYPVGYAGAHVGDPSRAVLCDPGYRDSVALTPWNTLNDPAFGWSNDPATAFGDVDGNGEREVIIPTAPGEHSHNLWQSGPTTTQAFSADFDAFEFTLEGGAIPPAANVQVGLSLSPSYMQHPWLGVFWEGAVLFRANDMIPDENGRISMDPVALAEIACPGGYTPCFEFRDAFNAADDTGKHTLLGQTRIVQTSFWRFNNPAGPVVIDDVAYAGAKSAVETAPSPNPGV